MSRSQIMVAVRARAPRIANQTSGLSTCRNLNRDRGMTAWWGEVIDISYGGICVFCTYLAVDDGDAGLVEVGRHKVHDLLPL